MEMPGRKWQGTADAYRFGMNGQEKDNEIFVGAMGAEYWEYDARTGRRWEIDPVVKEWESPYLTFSGNPILIEDAKGNDGITAGVVLIATQEIAAAAAATGVGAVAVPFIEAVGAITSLIITLNDHPISGTAIYPNVIKGRDETSVAKPKIDKRLVDRLEQSRTADPLNKNNFESKDGKNKPSKTERMQEKKAKKSGAQKSSKDSEYGGGSEHTSNSRGSTKQTHQKGRAADQRNKGGEKADKNRNRHQDSKKKKGN